MVVLSTFGATNANVLATARITYAMGDTNKLFSWAGKTQPKYHTPGNALWMNAAWSTLLIISGSFDTLTDMLIFVSWFFYGMSALGVFILRHKMKDVDRPNKVFGYPIVPLLFVLFTAFFLGTTVYTDISNYESGKVNTINSLLGIVITCIGLPVYLFQKKGPSSRERETEQ
jgi:APA family basic amino acid/polyamine antiporter